MGIDQPITISPPFNKSLVIHSKEERLTSYAGILILRQLDDLLGFTEWLASVVFDPRDPDSCLHSTQELLRTRLFCLALSLIWQDHSDRLRQDHVIRLATSDRDRLGFLKGPEIASQPTLSRFTSWLSQENNLQVLRRSIIELAYRKFKARRKTKLREITLDVDSFPIKAHGQQPGSARNGHYHMRCFHPIVVMISETADIVAAKLRPGNVHTASGVIDFLLPVIDQVESQFSRVAFVRGDAGYPSDKFLTALEERDVGYIFRIPSLKPLQKLAVSSLKRPAGRPPGHLREWCHEREHKAEDWAAERRVILVVVEKWGKQELDYFFLVTNFKENDLSGEEALDWYRQRGTFEGHLADFNRLQPHLSSSPRPKSHYRGKEPVNRYPSIEGEKANEVTFLLLVLAYNLLNGLREILNDRRQRGGTDCGWSLSRILVTVLLVAGRITFSGGRAKVELNRSAAVIWEKLMVAMERLKAQKIDSS